MRIAQLPHDETQRLNALRALQILDTPSTPGIDGIVRLASFICGTPIAVVSLLDERRQWFKARVGLEAPETSRDVAFCSHAILQEGLMVVADASADDRFADNPLVVSDPNIRFYAGAPLKTGDGFALGTLCVIDTVPRELTDEQLAALEILRDQVEVHLELIHRTQETEDALARANRELGERKAVEARMQEALVEVQRQATLLARSADAMERLHVITTDIGDSVSRPMEALLEFGCRAFGMGGGFISSIHGHELAIDHLRAPAGSGFAQGLSFEVNDTFCAETIKAGRPILCSRVSETPLSAHPAHKQFGIEAFLSAPVFVGGAVRGTLSFFSADPHEDFGDFDLRLLELAANWVGAYQVRRIAEDQRDQANRARSEFLARMSHEIRTPLHGVIGMVDLLKLSSLNGEQIGLVQSLDDSSRVLLEIVNDVLDFSKIEAGALTLESVAFDAGGVVEEAVGIVRPIADAKHIALTAYIPKDENLSFVGDSARIRQVLVNLLSNALKYTPEGRVDVTARSTPEGDEVVFSVSDTGIGIDAERQAAVFEPFVQAEASTSRRFGGSGLGLAISSRLTSLMGGSISVESQPGVGSIFTVKLPLARAIGQPSDRVACATNEITWQHPLGDLRVLIVDDNETNCQIAARMLAKLGVQSEVAGDGSSGVRLALADRFALILMDIQMPDIDGFAAAAQIRDALGDGCPPIVAMTASVSPDERDLCDQAAMPLLAKPFNLLHLQAALEAHLPREQAVDDLGEAVDEERLNILLSLEQPGTPSLLVLFGKEAAERLGQLDEALARADAQSARRAAHSLKGLAASVGAIRLAAAAAVLESSLTQSPPASVGNFDLRRELEGFMMTAQRTMALAS